MDAREQALIDAIVTSPDDAAYSVYADFLMERGGPLGELVALAGSEPARRDALVRELVGATAVVDDWHAGFPATITTIAADVDAGVRALDAIAEASVFALVRRLRLRIREYLPIGEVARIDRHLAQLGRPRLLEDVVIEQQVPLPRDHPDEYLRDGYDPEVVMHRYSEELIAAFPRLGHATEPASPTGMAELDRRGVDTSQLPPLATRDDRPLPLAARAVVAGLIENSDRVRRMLFARCEAGVVDVFCAAALEAIVGLPDVSRVNLVRMIGGPRTIQQATALASRDVLGAIRTLQAIGTPMTLLERLRLHRTGAPSCLPDGDADQAIARAGADPQQHLPPDLAERFAALDLEAIDHLIGVGYTTTLGDAIEVFAGSRRAPRAAALVWARVTKQAPSSALQRLGFRNNFELEPCFVTRDGAVDHRGRRLAMAMTEQLSLAHPSELTDEQLAAWRPAVRARSPRVRQLDRRMVLPLRLELWLHHNWTIDPFPSDAQLLRCHFRWEGGELTRTGRYRGFEFPVIIDPGLRRVVCRTWTPPPPFIHELSCELADAARQPGG